jgi:uncharacterized protein with PIN domain
MKPNKDRPDPDSPTVSSEQLIELKAKLIAGSKEPLLAAGTESTCPDCHGVMVTTNDLEATVPAPGLVFVVTRLPGARCTRCKAIELDGRAVGILESTVPKEIFADYETAVTHSSGSTLGTYFKRDLVRVLRLTGHEHLYWKVVDRDHALVEVKRLGDRVPTSGTRSRRGIRAQSRTPTVRPIADLGSEPTY